MLVEQHAADARAGLSTASFVSGYQGSPLGGLDQTLARATELQENAGLTLVPAINEELAATAVWGSKIEVPGHGRSGEFTAHASPPTAGLHRLLTRSVNAGHPKGLDETSHNVPTARPGGEAPRECPKGSRQLAGGDLTLRLIPRRHQLPREVRPRRARGGPEP